MSIAVSAMSATEQWFTRDLVCPRDYLQLEKSSDELACSNGHRYPIVEGIPIMLIDEVPQTMEMFNRSIRRAQDPGIADSNLYLDTIGFNDEQKEAVKNLTAHGTNSVDPVASFLIGATNGMAYRHLVGKLSGYPIPELRMPYGGGKTLLDLGCNWGRWSIAARRLGYRPIGLDPSLGAVAAARRVSRQLGVDVRYVVGDARFLPLRASAIDRVFSYSVLQHFSREDASKAVAEIGRVLTPAGKSLVQMPAKFGVRCLYHQARRHFREGRGFEVRYWSLPALRKLFERSIGPTVFSVDCFFGIGLQYSDRNLMPLPIRAAVHVSEILRRLSSLLPVIAWAADSVYVSSTKRSPQ